jgi:GH25 family lysozyme M1 (1,4-beta-N-acetylmuramidase)
MLVALQTFSARNFLWKIPAVVFSLTLATGSVFAQRPLGTDVSHWQASVNWTAVKNAGVTFAWAKATEGDYYTDPLFATHAAGAKAAGIYIGAYHFARPSQNPNITGANSADTEAAFFWSVASNYIKGGGQYMVPMLDWEDTSATVAAGFTVSQMSQWASRWCNTVSNYAQTNGITLKPIIYTGVWISQPSGTYPGLNTTVTGWPAWISAYNGQPHQTGAPASSYPWSSSSWSVWQYDDTNWSGGDSDVFNGTSNTIGTLIIGGLGPPTLTTQPILQRAVDIGGSASFAVAASGSPTLKYQWRLNGTNVFNATNSAYNLTNAQTTNAGYYTIVVTNSLGSVTSTPVSLLVYPPQVTMFVDNFDANTATNWTVNKSSSDTFVAFNFDYSALGISSAPNSTNSSTRGVQMKANLTLGTVAAISLSPTNRAFSGDYRLRFDAWLNCTGPFPVGGASSTEYLTGGIGTSGTRTEWVGSGSTADGFYFVASSDGNAGDTSATSDFGAYIGTTVQATNSGVYWAGTNSTARGNGNVYYQTAFPNGPAAPALQQANYAQQTGDLYDGSFAFAWHDVIVSKRGNTVDWIVNGIRFATISNATFTASNVCVGLWDPFNSLTDNTNLSFGLVDNVRVESPAVAPTFTLQPVAKAVKLGTNVTFTAAASGLPVPNFQWRFSGTNISGATNSSYALAFVAATNVGNYSVIASNFMGAITSTNAALALVAPTAAQFGATSLNLGGGSLQIGFSGDAYWTYTIEVSTNLTSWNAFTNLTSTNGIFNFNTSLTNAPQQFFRARVGP